MSTTDTEAEAEVSQSEEKEEVVPIINVHKLNVLAGGPSDYGAQDKAFDLIAVHGLFGDAHETWTPVDSATTWLESEVYDAYPNARVMTFGYDTENTTKGISTRESIRDKAVQLLEEIVALRKDLKTDTFRPLFFLGHDIGGILIKEALCIAADDYAKWSTIVHATRLLYFLGCPHRSESKGDMEDQIANFLVTSSKYPPVLVIEATKELSRSILEINGSFIASKLPTLTRIVNVSSDNPDSSEQGFDVYTTTLYIAFEEAFLDSRSHVDLTKSIRIEDFYTLLDEALDGHTPPSSSNDESARCLHTFQAQAAIAYHSQATYSHNKFQWIKDDKTYLDFVEDENPGLFYVRGSRDELHDACEFIYQHLVRNSPLGLDRQQNEILLNFQFNKNDDRRNTMMAMLTTLLSQIFSHNKELYEAVNLQFEQLCFYRSWTLAELILIFRITLTNSCHAGIICVFIGLDECNESQATEFIRSISDLAKNTERRFKMVFGSSGDQVPIELETWPRIDLAKPPVIADEPSGSGADTTILALLQEYPTFLPYQETIKEMLSQCGNDSRLRRLLCDEIQNMKVSSTRTELQTRLELLKVGTPYEVFTLILSTIPTERRPWAQRAIQWILFSRRPLTAAELATALALSPSTDSLQEELLPLNLAAALQETFRGLFVVRGEIWPRHNKFRDFFSDLDEKQEDVWYNVKGSAHEEITTGCLKYLSLPQAQDWISEKLRTHPVDVLETPLFESRNSLDEFAIKYWPKHYALISKDKRPVNKVVKFANSNAMRNWSEAYWLFSNPITRRDRSFLSPLPVFAGLGFEEVMDQLIASKSTLEKPKKDYHLALIEAVRNRHIQVVNTLLSRGEYDEDCVREALSIASSYCHSQVLAKLIDFASEKFKGFVWPSFLVYRVAQFGRTAILRRLFQLGASLKDTENPQGMTPLHIAAREGHSEIAKILIEHGADLLATAIYSRIPLHTASVYAHAHVVKILVQAGTDVNFVDEYQENALDLACHWGNFQVVDALAGSRIDMDRRDREGNFIPLTTAAFFGFRKCAEALLKHAASTEVYGAGRFTPLRYATSKNRVELCRLLLENEADPNTTEGGEPLLGECAADGFFDIVKLLVEAGAKVDTGTSEGWSALQRACQRGHIDIATYLLEHGAEVNHRSKAGQTAVIIAANNNYPELVQLLVDKGGDVHLATEAGWTALHLSYDSPATTRKLLENNANADRIANFFSPLFLAAANNHIESVEILLEFGANTEIVHADEEWQYNFTPLSVAAFYGCHEVCRLLLEAGANINHKSEKGGFPLLYALVNKKEDDVMRVLLEYHPDVDLKDDDGCTALNCIDRTTSIEVVKRLVNAGSDIETRDIDNYTPLCMAVMGEDIEIVKYLIKKKAKLEVKDTLGGSPLHIACRRVLLDIIKILVEAGADVNDVSPTIHGNPIQAAARCWYSRKEDDVQDKMIRYLIEEGKADVTVTGGLQGCALNAVCGWASAEMVKLLLDKGAKVDVADSQGRVAMHYAAVQSLEHFSPIISAGADIEVKDKMQRSVLHWAALGGRFDVLERVLYLSRSLVDQPDVDGWTPLLWAARQRGTEQKEGTLSAQKQIINFLVAQGADPCVVGKTSDGREWTTVKVAIYHGMEEEIIGLLMKKIKEKLESEGKADTWDDSIHATQRAEKQGGSCDSCLSEIYGFRYDCETCLDFAYCYKCYSSRHLYHPDHKFKEFGVEYKVVFEITSAASEDEDTDDDTDDNDSTDTKKSSSEKASKEKTESRQEVPANEKIEDQDEDDDDSDDDSDG